MVEDKTPEPWGYVNLYWNNGYDEVIVVYDEPANGNPAFLTLQHGPSRLSYRYIPIQGIKQFFITMYEPTHVSDSTKED